MLADSHGIECVRRIGKRRAGDLRCVGAPSSGRSIGSAGEPLRQRDETGGATDDDRIVDIGSGVAEPPYLEIRSGVAAALSGVGYLNLPAGGIGSLEVDAAIGAHRPADIKRCSAAASRGAAADKDVSGGGQIAVIAERDRHRDVAGSIHLAELDAAAPEAALVD